MTLTRVVTNEEADFRILALANDRKKFAVEVGMVLASPLQQALERGLENDWFRLLDISPVSAAPGRLLRIFKLTDAGMARLAEVAAMDGMQ